jgi:hypothetical protein
MLNSKNNEGLNCRANKQNFSSPLEEAEKLVQTAMEPNPDSTSKNTQVSVAVIFR